MVFVHVTSCPKWSTMRHADALHCMGDVSALLVTICRGAQAYQWRSQKQTNLGMTRVRFSNIARENAATICTQHCPLDVPLHCQCSFRGDHAGKLMS